MPSSCFCKRAIPHGLVRHGHMEPPPAPAHLPPLPPPLYSAGRYVRQFRAWPGNRFGLVDHPMYRNFLAWFDPDLEARVTWLQGGGKVHAACALAAPCTGQLRGGGEVLNHPTLPLLWSGQITRLETAPAWTAVAVAAARRLRWRRRNSRTLRCDAVPGRGPSPCSTYGSTPETPSLKYAEQLLQSTADP